MNVYCEACNRNHPLKPSEAEKVIYVLEAQQRGFEGEDVVRHETAECIWNALYQASDIECYAEHVEASLERRKLNESDVSQETDA